MSAPVEELKDKAEAAVDQTKETAKEAVDEAEDTVQKNLPTKKSGKSG